MGAGTGAGDNKPESKPSSSAKSKAEHLNVKHRAELNADAEHETQLIHLDNSATNEGKVNLAKV